MSNQTINDDNDIIEDVQVDSWVSDAPNPPKWKSNELQATTELTPTTEMGDFK